MQRRAAAGYAAAFLVVGVVAFSLIATATPPELTFQNPDHRLAEEDPVTIDGTEYTVANVEAEVEESDGGGHGGGGGASLVRTANLTTVNDSVRQTATWANGSQVTYLADEWHVRTTNRSATLTEVVDREAILQNDSRVENETTTLDGVEYVVRVDGDNRTLVPAGDYFNPATVTVAEGETIQFDGRAVTVERIDGDEALLTWTTTERQSVTFSSGNVTIGSTTYYAHFPDNDTVVLSQNFERLHEFHENEESFTTHKNGLWGVTLLSGTGAIFLVALSFLPSRY